MEKILNQILTEINSIKNTQVRIESGISSLNERLLQLYEGQNYLDAALNKQGQDIISIKKDVKNIKIELTYAWNYIKNSRGSMHGEELYILKRLNKSGTLPTDKETSYGKGDGHHDQ